MGVTRRSGEYDLIRLERRQRCQNYVERHRRQKQVAHTAIIVSRLYAARSDPSSKPSRSETSHGPIPRADPSRRGPSRLLNLSTVLLHRTSDRSRFAIARSIQRVS
jgi:hypothetical protein